MPLETVLSLLIHVELERNPGDQTRHPFLERVPRARPTNGSRETDELYPLWTVS